MREVEKRKTKKKKEESSQGMDSMIFCMDLYGSLGFLE